MEDRKESHRCWREEPRVPRRKAWQYTWEPEVGSRAFMEGWHPIGTKGSGSKMHMARKVQKDSKQGGMKKGSQMKAMQAGANEV